jgi:hypothetical protein
MNRPEPRNPRWVGSYCCSAFKGLYSKQVRLAESSYIGISQGPSQTLGVGSRARSLAGLPLPGLVQAFSTWL